MLFERRRLDNEEKQLRLRNELETEIDYMNNCAESSNTNPSKKKSREEILEDIEMCDYTESIESSDEEEEDDENNLTLNDANDFGMFSDERGKISKKINRIYMEKNNKFFFFLNSYRLFSLPRS